MLALLAAIEMLAVDIVLCQTVDLVVKSLSVPVPEPVPVPVLLLLLVVVPILDLVDIVGNKLFLLPPQAKSYAIDVATHNRRVRFEAVQPPPVDVPLKILVTRPRTKRKCGASS